MAIKIKAKQQLMSVGPKAGSYLFVMTAELYSRLEEDKVIEEASVRSGIPRGTLNAAWGAIGDVIKAWATEGHSVAVPGLGSMRFVVNAEAVEKVEEVNSSLITTRKVIFTPSADIKDELHRTAVQITCYDKDGNVIKRVTSEDAAGEAA